MKKIVADTKYGKLQGTCQKDVEGNDFCAFKGIRYAKAPIGDLRFKDPLDPENWDGIKDATKYGSSCPQHSALAGDVLPAGNSSEDCLYLNVFTKNLDSTSPRPVMVWIHGGAFMLGQGDDTLYGANYLLRKDIVLVTINYRVGVLGFLNLDDEVAPGNQGLKDQAFALKWVKENIRNFGGDPENVTIFGESAGAASVHYLCLSPLSKGLFHKAIIQSAVCINPWASVLNPKAIASRLSEILGCKSRDPKEIVEFLRKVDCQELVKTQDKTLSREEKLQFMFPFGPGIDDKSKNPFMPVPLEVAIQSGIQVPLIIGHNNAEGIVCLLDTTLNDLKALNLDFEKCLHPRTLATLKRYNYTSKDLKLLYFGNDVVCESNKEKYIEMLGDLHFVGDMHEIIKIQIERSCAPTYMYVFSYDKGFSLTKAMSNCSMKGASHFDESFFLFNGTIYDAFNKQLKKGTEEYRMMEILTDMWTDFARTGRPTPSNCKFAWQPVTDSTVLRHMKIGDYLSMSTLLNFNERFSYKLKVINKL